MVAQIITVNQNGVDQARSGKGLNHWRKIDVEHEHQIKEHIQGVMREFRTLRLKGHVVVKWHDKMFVCEPKGTTYSRVQVEYHPLAIEFDI